MSRASTISAEERQMALTEKEFSITKWKMDKIDHRLHEMYKIGMQNMEMPTL